MSTAAIIGKKAIWLINELINMFVLTVILLLLVFGSYAIWDSNQIHSAASSEKYEIYKPTAKNEGLSFAQLQAINPEVFAWLTVYGTHIDYPVAQGPDNMKYVNTNAMGKHSVSGAIFLNSDNSRDFSDFNSILYGHHMEMQVMFGEIGYFSDEEYFDARRYGTLYFGEKEHGLEFFAFLHTNAFGEIFRPKITGRENQQAYLDMLMRTATYIRSGVPVTLNDRIVLLSTCSEASTNGRDILIGKISDEIYADPFKINNVETQRYTPVIDELIGFWTNTPVWARVIMTALPFLLILLIIVYTKKQRSQRKELESGKDR